MKHNLMTEYRKAEKSGKDVLQPVINELQDILAIGRTYIKITELLGAKLEAQKKRETE